MGNLTREDIIDELTGMVGEADHVMNVLRGGSDAHARSLATTRATLSSYATDLLIELHMTANEPERDNVKATYRFAKEGKSERWVRSWIMLREDHDHLFAGDRHYHVGGVEAFINSLALYPELTYEDTDEYYQKVLALTGVVNAIQYALKDSEGYYYNYTEDAHPRLLTYSMDPADNEGIDKVMRITSSDLAELILSRPDDWERIAQIVTERETDDVEFILSILEGNGIFPISNGAL